MISAHRTIKRKDVEEGGGSITEIEARLERKYIDIFHHFNSIIDERVDLPRVNCRAAPLKTEPQSFAEAKNRFRRYGRFIPKQSMEDVAREWKGVTAYGVRRNCPFICHSAAETVSRPGEQSPFQSYIFVGTDCAGYQLASHTISSASSVTSTEDISRTPFASERERHSALGDSIWDVEELSKGAL